MDWPFTDDPNTACFTTAGVLNGSPILRVVHDYDADWQFHDDAPPSLGESEPELVSLGEIIDRDSTIATLHDLPYGWRAERESVTSQWIRHKNNPFPSYADDGYYLEDALWLADHMPDINRCNGSRLVGCREWTFNFPGPLVANVIRIKPTTTAFDSLPSSNQ